MLNLNKNLVDILIQHEMYSRITAQGSISWIFYTTVKQGLYAIIIQPPNPHKIVSSTQIFIYYLL